MIYVSTEDKNFDDIKRFLGQANFDQQITVAEYISRCCLQGPIAPGAQFLDRLVTLAVGDKTILRSLLTEEAMISLTAQLPVNFVPWDRRTELVPSDLYVLKPIPQLGIALSAKVRIY